MSSSTLLSFQSAGTSESMTHVEIQGAVLLIMSYLLQMYYCYYVERVKWAATFSAEKRMAQLSAV